MAIGRHAVLRNQSADDVEGGRIARLLLYLPRVIFEWDLLGWQKDSPSARFRVAVNAQPVSWGIAPNKNQPNG